MQISFAAFYYKFSKSQKELCWILSNLLHTPLALALATPSGAVPGPLRTGLPSWARLPPTMGWPSKGWTAVGRAGQGCWAANLSELQLYLLLHPPTLHPPPLSPLSLSPVSLAALTEVQSKPPSGPADASSIIDDPSSGSCCWFFFFFLSFHPPPFLSLPPSIPRSYTPQTLPFSLPHTFFSYSFLFPRPE